MKPIELQIKEVEEKLGRKIFLKTSQPSPFRKDSNPSFSWYVCAGILCWIDFATGEKGTYESIFDFKLNFEIPKSKCERKKKEFITKSFEFEKDEYLEENCAFWKKYEIEIKDLKLFHISPCKKIKFKSGFGIINKPQYPMFVYELQTGVKIYRPLSKECKFLSSAKGTDIQGKHIIDLKDKWKIGIITKSLKDVIVLHKLGWPAIAPSSESITEGPIFEYAKQKFGQTITLFDNDQAGIQSSEKIYKLHKIPFILLDKAKDASDYVEAFSYNELQNYLDQKIYDIIKNRDQF